VRETTTDASTAGVEMAFAWFKSKSERAASKLISRDRQHLEARARHFLKSYLKADEVTKPRFYRAVEDAVQECQVKADVLHPSPELEDAQIAMAMSNAATEIVMEATRPKVDEGLEVSKGLKTGKGLKVNRGPGAFRTDAYATVAMAYRRAAGIYTEDRDMQELGTAAVHLLTMATSYVKSQAKDLSPSDAG
jgi:hypothetical protein